MENNKLVIQVLVDNFAANKCYAEHGLSYVVNYDKKILFDTGASDLFIKNAEILNINLQDIDSVVLSHGHYDHGNGLNYLTGKNIITHPASFSKRFSGRSMRDISVQIDFEKLEQNNRISFSREPFWLSDKIVFLGEIPRNFTFEYQEYPFYFEDKKVDKVIDDSALAIKTHFGLFVIAGCAHAGICNTIEHALKVTGANELYGVIGGFHLTENNQRLIETISYLNSINARIVMPSHCTGLPALAAINNAFNGEQVKTGMVYTFPKADGWKPGVS